jgi:hypothetical protein
MGFFRREIEVTLKTLGAMVLVGLIVLPVAWGYEQRRQARTWQNVACAYRIKEVTRQTPLLASVERAQDACATLAKLGFDLSQEDFVPLPTSGRSSDARYGAVMSGRPSAMRYGTVARTSALASPSGPERTSTR